jgi:hypothetical protein
LGVGLVTEEDYLRFYAILALVSLFLISTQAETAMGQECGPGCPVCSGKAEGALLAPATVFGSALYIPDGEEETAVLNLRYGLFSWMDIGIGYAVDEEEPLWSVRFAPVAEDPEGWRPALILGTGSVQAGGSDQSAFVVLSKTVEIVEACFGVRLSGGYATDLPDLAEDWGLGTVAFTLFDRVNPFYTYDGVNSHLGLALFATDWLTLTGYFLELEEPGIMAAGQWGLGASGDN